MEHTIIKFWGVRGSIPTPGAQTMRYGGNTACVEIQFPNVSKIIVDAGSGIRGLGNELVESSNPVKAYIFLSHFHWDHIQGLPFFKAAYKKGNEFIIYGCDEPDVDLTKIISMQMNPTYFPVTVEDMAAKINFRTIQEGYMEVEGVTIQTKFMNHPGYTLGFRFNYQGKSIVYMSDNEPFFHPKNNSNKPHSLEDRFENFIEDDKEENLIDFIRDADIFIHDTQYFIEEYQQRITWGHSPYSYPVDLAVKGRVKQLVLFHHDPDHNDEKVDRIAVLSRARLKDHNYPIPCNAAREGEVLRI